MNYNFSALNFASALPPWGETCPILGFDKSYWDCNGFKTHMVTRHDIRCRRIMLGGAFKSWEDAVGKIVCLHTKQSESLESLPLGKVQKAQKEQEWIKQMKREEETMRSLGVTIKDRQFILPEIDFLLAEKYQLSLEEGVPYLKCFGYVYYHWNMPMHSPINPDVYTPFAETAYLRQVTSPKRGDMVLYWDKPRDVKSLHAGILYASLEKTCEKTWQIVSKWGIGPVVSHPIDLLLPSYSLGYVFFRPKYGIPLYRQIAGKVDKIFETEKRSHFFHPMLPSPLSPFGVAERWRTWIQKTDQTMTLFSEAALGERTREICAKRFVEEWWPTVLTLQKNPWAISRTEVSSRIKRDVSKLDEEMYALLFSSFWDKIPSKKEEAKLHYA